MVDCRTATKWQLLSVRSTIRSRKRIHKTFRCFLSHKQDLWVPNYLIFFSVFCSPLLPLFTAKFNLFLSISVLKRHQSSNPQSSTLKPTAQYKNPTHLNPRPLLHPSRANIYTHTHAHTEIHSSIPTKTLLGSSLQDGEYKVWNHYTVTVWDRARRSSRGSLHTLLCHAYST